MYALTAPQQQLSLCCQTSTPLHQQLLLLTEENKHSFSAQHSTTYSSQSNIPFLHSSTSLVHHLYTLLLFTATSLARRESSTTNMSTDQVPHTRRFLIPGPNDDSSTKFILTVTFLKNELWEFLTSDSPATMLFYMLLIPLVCITVACVLTVSIYTTAIELHEGFANAHLTTRHCGLGPQSSTGL